VDQIHLCLAIGPHRFALVRKKSNLSQTPVCPIIKYLKIY
jgi:hypothetical protein